MDDTIDMVVTKFRSQLKEYFKDCNFLKKKYFKFKKEYIEKYNEDDYDKINYAFIEHIKNDITYSTCLNKLWFFTDLILFLRLIKKKSRTISSRPGITKKKLTERFNKIMDILKSFNDDEKTTKDKSNKIKNNFIVLVKKIGETAIDNPKKAERMLKGIEEKVYDIKPEKKKRSKKKRNESNNNDTSGNRTIVKTREGAPEIRQQQDRDRGGRDRNTGNTPRSRKADRDYGDTKERKKGKGWSLPSFGFGSKSGRQGSRNLDFSGDDFKSRDPRLMGSNPIARQGEIPFEQQKINIPISFNNSIAEFDISKYSNLSENLSARSEIDDLISKIKIEFRDNSNNTYKCINNTSNENQDGTKIFFCLQDNIDNNKTLTFVHTYKYLIFNEVTYTKELCPDIIHYTFYQPKLESESESEISEASTNNQGQTNTLNEIDEKKEEHHKLIIIMEDITISENQKTCDSIMQINKLIQKDEFKFKINKIDDKQLDTEEIIEFKNINYEKIKENVQNNSQQFFDKFKKNEQFEKRMMKGGSGIEGVIVFGFAILGLLLLTCAVFGLVICYKNYRKSKNIKKIFREINQKNTPEKELLTILYKCYKKTNINFRNKKNKIFKKYEENYIYVFNTNFQKYVWIPSSNVNNSNSNYISYENEIKTNSSKLYQDKTYVFENNKRERKLYINSSGILYYISDRDFLRCKIPRGVYIISIKNNNNSIFESSNNNKNKLIKLEGSSNLGNNYTIKYRISRFDKDKIDLPIRRKLFLKGGSYNEEGDEDSITNEDIDEIKTRLNDEIDYSTIENTNILSFNKLPLVLIDSSKNLLNTKLERTDSIILDLEFIDDDIESKNKIKNYFKYIHFTFNQESNEAENDSLTYTNNICSEFPPPPPLSLMPNCN